MAISSRSLESKEPIDETRYQLRRQADLVIEAPQIDFSHLLKKGDFICSIDKDSMTGDYLFLIENRGQKQQTIIIWNPESKKFISKDDLGNHMWGIQLEFLSKDLIWGFFNNNPNLWSHDTRLVAFFNRSFEPIKDKLFGYNEFVALSVDENKVQIVQSSMREQMLKLITIIKDEKDNSFRFIESHFPYSQLADEKFQKIHDVVRISNNEIAVAYIDSRLAEYDIYHKPPPLHPPTNRIRFCAIESGNIILKKNLDISVPYVNYGHIKLDFLNNKYLSVLTSSFNFEKNNLFYFAKNKESQQWKEVFKISHDKKFHRYKSIPFAAFIDDRLYNLETDQEISGVVSTNIGCEFGNPDNFYCRLPNGYYARAVTAQTLQEKIISELEKTLIGSTPCILPIIASYSTNLFSDVLPVIAPKPLATFSENVLKPTSPISDSYAVIPKDNNPKQTPIFPINKDQKIESKSATLSTLKSSATLFQPKTSFQLPAPRKLRRRGENIFTQVFEIISQKQCVLIEDECRQLNKSDEQRWASWTNRVL